MRPPLTKRCPPLPILSEGFGFGDEVFVQELDLEFTREVLFVIICGDDSCPEAGRDRTFSAVHPAASRRCCMLVPIESTKCLSSPQKDPVRDLDKFLDASD